MDNVSNQCSFLLMGQVSGGKYEFKSSIVQFEKVLHWFVSMDCIITDVVR